ncbi:glycosyltransferase family 2 protein [Streptomyces sp. ID05-04B]|uniref:glycosyltransferase family 2 protein n=1 Tax=Streptomyces sp. ID05-04B TaxID=3028661 RepID=UPI0029C2CD48|nr:glycosyltransferase family 2 protein [Streptomyces sp. ID05-04B]MDX5568167.1 glycosyltransferase family 2 protein [Streptomyces sp. ID05-04B]
MLNTVVIPVHQELSVLRIFLDSLVRTLESDTQLLVVNDGSGAAVQTFLEERLFPLKESGVVVEIIQHEDPFGCAASINEALPLALGDYVYLIDSDIILEPEWQSRMRATLESDESVGMTGGVLVYPQTGGIQHCGVTFTDSVGRHLLLNARPSALPHDRYPVQLVVFALFAMKRQVLEETGSLDEDFFNGYEDFDFQMRARSLGYRTLVDPRVVAYHWERSNGIHRVSNRKSNLGRFWKRWGHALEQDLWDRLFTRLEEAVAGTPASDAPAVGVDLAEARGDATEFWKRLARQTWRPERVLNASHKVSTGTPVPLAQVLPSDLLREESRLLLLTDNFVQLSDNWLWWKERSTVRGDDLIVDLYGNCVTSAELQAGCWPGRKIR